MRNAVTISRGSSSVRSSRREASSRRGRCRDAAASSSRSSAPTVSGRWRRIAASRRSSRQTSSTRSGSRATVCTSPAMRSSRRRSTALRFARRSLRASDGARVSVDLSAWTRIREYGPVRFRELLERLAPDVIFANEAEWEIVGAAYGLAPTAVVKRGARGVLVLGEERVELPAARRSRSSMRRAPAMHWPRAFSSAAPSLRSRPPPAASASSERCRDRRLRRGARGFGGRRARDDADRARLSCRRRRRRRARVGASRARGRRRPRDDRRARRRDPGRAHGGRADTFRRRARARLGRAISRRASCRARSVRRQSAERSRCAAPPASGSWGPAGSAACTAAFPHPHRTCQPTSASSLARRRSSSRLESSRCSTSRRRSSSSSHWACRCSASARTSCRSSIRRTAARRSGTRRVRRTRLREWRGVHWDLGGGGLLLARPPDRSLDDVEPLIEEALAEAERRGVTGQAVTPFVLSFLHERSEGRTLAANRELVVANAGLAAEVAVASASA